MSTNPRVFISHASEDKERFVLDFYQKLRAKGVDAWLDMWEMLPGDSLVDKIFEEGIKTAQAVVVVISSNSITKPWVREELDAAMVKRINKGSRLIPVVIDNCEVPECLQATLWERISDLNDYGTSLDRIVSAIFGHRDKPPLGDIPEYAKPTVETIPGHDRTDSIILKIVSEIGLENDSIYAIETVKVLEEASSLGISEELAWESLEVLDHDSMLQLHRVLGGRPPHLEVTALGLEKYAETFVTDYNGQKAAVISSIVNHDLSGASEIATRLSTHVALVEHVFNLLEMNGYLKISKAFGRREQVYNISPKLKRLIA